MPLSGDDDDVYMEIMERKNEMMVDIRQWEDGKKPLAGKGVSLNLRRFRVLQEYMVDITEALEAVRSGENKNSIIHLGGMFYALVKSPYVCVNIRRFFKPKDQDDTGLLPGSGIALKRAQWNRLVEINNNIQYFLPEMKDVELCYQHRDCLDVMCSECYPLNGQAYIK